MKLLTSIFVDSKTIVSGILRQYSCFILEISHYHYLYIYITHFNLKAVQNCVSIEAIALLAEMKISLFGKHCFHWGVDKLLLGNFSII